MSPYDYIIIGSGAGGSAAAYRLATAGTRGLLLEKGGELPRDGSTLDLAAVDGNWKSEPLPLGLKPEILAEAEEARHFDGFASARDLKRDGETAFLSRVRHLPNLRILTGAAVIGLLPADGDSHRGDGVVCADGRIFRGEQILLAAGALHSPGLVGSYLIKTGLDRHLPMANAVGRYYKSHLKAFLLAFSPKPQTDLLRKTVLLTNAKFPRSSVQTLKWIDGEILASQTPGWVPRVLVNALGRRAYGFFLQTEDGSHPDNRVLRAVNGHDHPVLDFRPERVPRAREEHWAVLADFRRALSRAGYFTAAKPVPLAGSAHACGTLAAGNDPSRSVVDEWGRVHGLANLYVADGSALPRSSRVNPALTIYAWALRLADRLAGRAFTESPATS